MSTRTIAEFVNALFLVYYLFVIVRVIFSWVGIPSNRSLLTLFRFVYDVTEPYLGIFRRFIPPLGGIDFSPLVALLALRVIQQIVIRLILEL